MCLHAAMQLMFLYEKWEVVLRQVYAYAVHVRVSTSTEQAQQERRISLPLFASQFLSPFPKKFVI